jgi:hypothetical protein
MSKHFVDAQGRYLGAFVGAAATPDVVIPPAGGIEVPTAPPDGRCIWNGSAWGAPVLSPVEQRHEALKTAFEATGALERLRNATPSQIDTFIDANVTDLAGARAVLKALAKAVAYLARGHED